MLLNDLLGDNCEQTPWRYDYVELTLQHLTAQTHRHPQIVPMGMIRYVLCGSSSMRKDFVLGVSRVSCALMEFSKGLIQHAPLVPWEWFVSLRF